MSDLGAYVIAAGGTGGHIFPGIALAREIRGAAGPPPAIVFVGTGRGPREPARARRGLSPGAR